MMQNLMESFLRGIVFSDEVITYHLSTLLGLDNVPIVTLVQYNKSSPQWQAVAQTITQANWTDGMIVPVIQWIQQLANKRLL